jgi:hypothetical protein
MRIARRCSRNPKTGITLCTTKNTIAPTTTLTTSLINSISVAVSIAQTIPGLPIFPSHRRSKRCYTRRAPPSVLLIIAPVTKKR